MTCMASGEASRAGQGRTPRARSGAAACSIRPRSGSSVVSDAAHVHGVGRRAGRDRAGRATTHAYAVAARARRVGRPRRRIDEHIADAARNWRVERLAVIDRLLLRLAVHELLEPSRDAAARRDRRSDRAGAALQRRRGRQVRQRRARRRVPHAEGRRKGRDRARLQPRPSSQMSNEDDSDPSSGAPISRRSRELGIRPYPHRFATTDTRQRSRRRGTARARRRSSRPTRVETVTAGRIVSIRSFGKASFFVLSDGRSRIQVYVRQDALSRARLRAVEAARLRRSHRRRRPSVPHQDQRAVDLGVDGSSSSPSASSRCPRSGTGCRTSRSATASAISISSSIPTSGACSRSAAARSPRFASSSSRAAFSKSRRR